MYTVCVPGNHRSEKRASDPLKLELQMVVRCHAGAGNWVLWESSQSSLLLSISPALKMLPLKRKMCHFPLIVYGVATDWRREIISKFSKRAGEMAQC